MSTIKRFRVNGTDAHEIKYERQPNGTYSIYALEHPYNPYSASAVDCHLYGNGQVCIKTGREPRTLDRAIAISQVWMRGYSHYCKTGRFGPSSGRVNV